MGVGEYCQWELLGLRSEGCFGAVPALEQENILHQHKGNFTHSETFHCFLLLVQGSC